MDNSARAVTDSEQALADFHRLGKTLRSAFNPAANSLFSDMGNVVTGRELRGAKDDASAFIGTLSDSRYEHLETLVSEMIVWVDPYDGMDLEELIEIADANKLAIWPDAVPAAFLKDGEFLLRLHNPFVQGVIDLQRLAAEMKTDRRRAIALIEAFHRDRLPFLWGWFQRGGLPLSQPDPWWRSLRFLFENSETTVAMGFGDAELDVDEPSWCDSFRHQLMTFVSCDEPAVVIRMLERLIEVATTFLRSVRRRDNFCERYHDVLKLLVNGERLGAPLGETPNLWAEVCGLPPIPETGGSRHESLAGMASIVEQGFAYGFDAILFAEVETSDFWETFLELSVWSEDDELAGTTLPFDAAAKWSACEARYYDWLDVLATVENWLKDLLPEAKKFAVICGEIPKGWNDILCDGSSLDREFAKAPSLLPHRDELDEWVSFADSVRPLFTLPDRPLHSMTDFVSWLDYRCSVLTDGEEADPTMPWTADPPFAELRRELGALTLRNAGRWLDAHHLSGWPGDGTPIPDDVFQQERSLKKLLDWCSEQRRKQWQDEANGSSSNVGDGSPEQDRSHQEAVSLADSLHTSTAIGTTADRAAVPPANIDGDDDSFAALLHRVKAFAASDLKGIQRRVIELLVSSNGEMPIADIATDPAVNWQPPNKASIDSVKRALNTKLRSLKAYLSVRDNRLRLVQGAAKKTRTAKRQK